MREIQDRNLKGAELTATLEALTATDVNKRRNAGRRLLKATPIEARRIEVSKVLAGRLSEPDNETQRLIIQRWARGATRPPRGLSPPGSQTRRFFPGVKRLNRWARSGTTLLRPRRSPAGSSKSEGW